MSMSSIIPSSLFTERPSSTRPLDAAAILGNPQTRAKPDARKKHSRLYARLTERHNDIYQGSSLMIYGPFPSINRQTGARSFPERFHSPQVFTGLASR